MRSSCDALEEIFRLHGQSLFLCALAVTRAPEKAEDAVQEAFFRLFRANKSPANLKAYVYRAVRNAALDQVTRIRQTEALVEDAFFDPGHGPRETAIRNQFAEQVERALRTLSPDERETIVHHLYAGLAFREIAELRDVSINTVASWYRRGLEKMKLEIER